MTTDTTIEIQNVVFACPDKQAGGYDPGARPQATFYAKLLALRIAREDWFVLEDERDPNGLDLAFGDGPTDQYNAPHWPDPEYPQQMHLDVSVHDLDEAEQRALDLGAAKLQDNGALRVYSDPAGHPFCLYASADQAAPRIERVVIDCFSPRALADFADRLGAIRLSDEGHGRNVYADPGRGPAGTARPRPRGSGRRRCGGTGGSRRGVSNRSETA
jgi:hypothetical protein